MKRLPIIVSLLAVIALSCSVAYWFLQLYKGPDRPIVAAPPAAAAEPSAEAAATLFGGQAVTVVASNYQLTGVVAAGRESVAILVADGQTPKALVVGKEIAPGVTVKEVHPRYVMLSEGGVLKRIELATDTKAGPNLAPPIGVDPAQQQAMQQQAMQQQQMQQQQMQQQQMQQQQMQQQQSGPPPDAGAVPPPPPPMQMPPPTRNMNPGAQPPVQ